MRITLIYSAPAGTSFEQILLEDALEMCNGTVKEFRS